MRILITGAGGFVGSHLAARLTRAYEVYGLARQPIEIPNVQWVNRDLAQPLEAAELPDQIDAVIHLAQSRHFREFPERAADIFNVNLRSTFDLLDYARQAGATRFIYASSGGIYGYQDGDFVETDPVNPTNFYLTSKYASELLIRSYTQQFSTVICRLFFVYGRGQNPDMLIPRLARSVATGQAVTLQGIEGIRINPTYVDDVVTAFERTLSLDGHHTINVAGTQTLSLREITNTIAACVGCKPVFDVHEEQRPNHLTADISQMKTLLHVPQMRFAEGVVEVCREVLAREKG